MNALLSSLGREQDLAAKVAKLEAELERLRVAGSFTRDQVDRIIDDVLRDVVTVLHDGRGKFLGWASCVAHEAKSMSGARIEAIEKEGRR